MELLNNAGAVITILMGCLGLFFPGRASSLTGLSPKSAEARAEFRGTLGVTFLLLGLYPLLSQSPHAFLTAGLCWFGAALGRVVSIFADGCNTPKNWMTTALELLPAGLLIWGEPAGVFRDAVGI
jgi:hypothetical protein